MDRLPPIVAGLHRAGAIGRDDVAFRDFSFPEVLQALALTLVEADLFGGVAPMDLSAEFVERPGSP